MQNHQFKLICTVYETSLKLFLFKIGWMGKGRSRTVEDSECSRFWENLPMSACSLGHGIPWTGKGCHWKLEDRPGKKEIKKHIFLI